MNDSSTAATERHSTGQIVAYFVPLTFLLYVIDPVGPFFDIVVTYVLKDRLHATLSEAAQFRLMAALPVYGAFVFGLTRDLWNPLGRRDRGYFLVFGLLTAALMFVLAAQPLSMGVLTVAVLSVMLLTRFIVAAYQGLMALIAQERAMSGRLSAVWQFTAFATALLSSACSGLIVQHASTPTIFRLLGLAAVGVAAFGLWKPAAVFGGAYAAPEAQGLDLRGDLRRLIRHRAIYPAVALMLMFQFSPGTGVVLQYYMVDVLKGSDAMYGYWYAMFLAGFLPVLLLYGYLCQRVPFGRLLFWSAVLAVPQVIPLALIHSAWGAVLLALPIGMLGGLMWAAINDLAMRSCPPGLHGSLMMVVSGVNALGIRGGDWVGTWIYSAGGRHGFLGCAIVTTLVYVAVLGVIRCVPEEITRTADGQALAAA